MSGNLGPGSTVKNGQIKILSRLGEGGFGEVFLAQTAAGLKALKVVDTSVWRDDEYQVFNAMLMSEVSFLSTLAHPALPGSYGFFAEESRYFLIMDWFKGHNLQQYVQDEGPLELDDLFCLIGALVDLLSYLHRECPGVVVFGDLKPANIMRVSHGDYRLVDLGLVTKQGAKLSRKIAVFSPNYSAPERARCGASHPDQDIFSLGATVFFGLTGREPQRDMRPHQLQEVLNVSLARAEHDWGEASLHCLRKILTLTLGAMDKDPERRPDGIRTFQLAWQRTREIREKEMSAQKSVGGNEIVRLLYEDK